MPEIRLYFTPGYISAAGAPGVKKYGKRVLFFRKAAPFG